MGRKKGQKKRQENPDGSTPAPEQQENSGPSGLGSSQSQASQQQSGAREQERSSDQCQVNVTSQSAAMQQSATAPAQSSSALSAEAKIVGKGRSGGQSVPSAGTTTSTEQSTSAVTKSSKKKQKGKSQETPAPATSAIASTSPSGVEGTVTDLEKLTLKTKSEASQQVASGQPATDKPTGTKSKGKGKSGAQLPQQTSTGTVQEKAPTKSSETKAGGKGQKGKGQEIPKTVPSATPSTSTQQVGDTVAKNDETKFIVPKREWPGSGVHAKIIHDEKCLGGKLTIEVNYLPIIIKNPKLKIYHYNVTFNPDAPKFLLRDALEKMRESCFPDRSPAFDGRSNMYVAGRPLHSTRNTIHDTVTVHNAESGRDKEFVITVTLVGDDSNIAQLLEYCENGISSNTPQTVIQATDIALRSGLKNFILAGRSFFNEPEKPTPLGGGMELWSGFYQSAVPAWKPYLNIDVANKAFPVKQPVLEYLKNDMRLPAHVLQNGLAAGHVERLRRFIVGLKISYSMPSPEGPIQERVYKVSGLGRNALQERFDYGGRQMSVYEFYQTVKKCPIKYKNLPLLEYGTQRSLVPIELCSIYGKQAIRRKLDESQTGKMVRATARPPAVRKSRIEQNIQDANYASNPTLREFGIEVESQFKKVEAVIIRPPAIAYHKSQVKVTKGAWEFKDNFNKSAKMPPWGILNFNPKTDRITELEKLMKQVGFELGLTIPAHRHYIEHLGFIRRDHEKTIDGFLNEFRNIGVRLVIVVLANSSENYGQVKRASELRVGLLTQCLKIKTLENIDRTIVKNILLKVNAKLKGVNHCLADTLTSIIPAFLARDFMLVGADVTHPSPGAENTPSIAAVAASHDAFGFQYRMKYKSQPSRQEMITKLDDMMKEHLESYRQEKGRLPENIFYFRDGVSEGQFQQVLGTELVAIKKACNMVQRGYEAKVLFLVVQKRHHTRFFPNKKDADVRTGNVPAGTLVDHTITHPTEFDFFLVSHHSIQGTARPTKYHVLFDDINYSSFKNLTETNRFFELERLTYYLCHMFARCTRSVSYPAPTYYAHLAAFRARAWSDRAEDQAEDSQIHENIVNEYPMFFT